MSKNTSLMFLSCFLAGLANNSTINTIFLADKPHTKIYKIYPYKICFFDGNNSFKNEKQLQADCKYVCHFPTILPPTFPQIWYIISTNRYRQDSP